MDVLFIDLRCGNIEFAQQLRNETLYYHSLFPEAVRPWRVQPESHCCYSHFFSLP
jgi:hypothetical protein